VPRPFLIYKSIISIPTHLPDNFSDFIFLANSMIYAENRQNRGLDKNCQDREAGLEALLVGSPGLADANVIDAIGWF
jgi:hypothetical protein